MNALPSFNVATATAAPSAIGQKAMLAGLKISMWAGRKLDKKITAEVNQSHGAAADAARVTKSLVSKQALADILRIQNAARMAHYARTLPWADSGARILCNAGYAAYGDELRKLEYEFFDAVDAFVSGYADYVDAARLELNGMFKADDYPAVSDIRGRFRFERSIWPMPSAPDFRVDMVEGEADRIRADIQRQFDVAIRAATRDVFERINETVGHMVEKLRAFVPHSGKKGDKAEGVFRDSLVENVRDLVALMPSLNVTGDAVLDGIAKRMETLCKFDAEALRDDKQARQDTADAAAGILADISDFLA
ncbi:MAG: hypothetical protein E5W82_10615 [Mesorhizobium sp.]|nr:MAG: hypothetical protein E5W82_10615 [Mesorhizobium sp.]